MNQTLNEHPDRVGTVELRAALEEALGRHLGQPCRIASLTRRPSDYRSTWAMEELDVRLDDGTLLGLMFKDLSRQAQLESARHAKPDFLYDPLREIETYRSVLTPEALGTARFYGAVVDRDAGHYWLFLERVQGPRLAEVGEFETWQRVAAWLAGLHARFAGESGQLLQSAGLIRYNADFYRLWLQRLQAFACQGAAALPRGAPSRIDWLARRYDQVVDRLAALPATFLHGEFYAANVIVRETATGVRVCPIDWEMAALGPGLIDVAALTAGAWSNPEREALASAYLAELSANHGTSMAPAEFLDTLGYCHLHLAIQWLGWSLEWKPPPEHRHNWLGEALQLAEKLGL